MRTRAAMGILCGGPGADEHIKRCVMSTSQISCPICEQCVGGVRLETTLVGLCHQHRIAWPMTGAVVPRKWRSLTPTQQRYLRYGYRCLHPKPGQCVTPTRPESFAKVPTLKDNDESWIHATEEGWVPKNALDISLERVRPVRHRRPPVSVSNGPTFIAGHLQIELF
jgi:hypothetical protein